MRSSSSDHFGVMQQLVSCPPAAFQGLDHELMVAGDSHKRQFYSIFEAASEDTGDEDQLGDEYSPLAGKKRRLTTEQVKALEKNFEVENKLEPERKLHLARELGLQPRQVAVWFQNRRARWKTKQLEKDYEILKARYDALKLDYDAVIQEKAKLQIQVARLNEKLKLSDHSENQPPKVSAIPELRREVSFESTVHLLPNNEVSDNITAGQSDLHSLKVPLQLLSNNLGEDIGSSSSESDDSEVLDEENPLQMELPKQRPLSYGDPPTNLPTAAAKEDNENLIFSHQIPLRSVIKLEDESYSPEEGSNLYLFNLEDHVTNFSWWD